MPGREDFIKQGVAQMRSLNGKRGGRASSKPAELAFKQSERSRARILT
jgi:hypothetical protein